jgi:oligopeptide/dipeptide ABC transporter ATP-binding protein
VRFQGKPIDPDHLGDYRRQVQIIFQDPYTSLPPRMRVGDIIADPLRIHGTVTGADIEPRVTELLRDVGLNPARRNEYPFQFSGGQRQRIGIARALAIQPSLLLLDEAVSALDVSVQAQVLNLLKDLQDRLGLTYIFISHDLNVVRHMSDRIAVMYLGKIVELGPAEEVTGVPLHPYTVALLSAAPSLQRVRGNRIRLQGEPPKPTAPPPGCPFHPRCPMAREICSVKPPPLKEWAPGRVSACHFAPEAVQLLRRDTSSRTETNLAHNAHATNGATGT